MTPSCHLLLLSTCLSLPLKQKSLPSFMPLKTNNAILTQECADLLVPTITNIVVKPLLKKPSLDKELLSNYPPISNLSFLSKLSERVLSRLKGYLASNNLLNPNQSAYTKHHSKIGRASC